MAAVIIIIAVSLIVSEDFDGIRSTDRRTDRALARHSDPGYPPSVRFGSDGLSALGFIFHSSE